LNANDRVQAYREIQIKTANQVRLIVMLYDGAIKHINLALDAFAEGHRRYDAINNHVIGAQDILSELMACLDFDRGGALAKNLFSLYSFMTRRLLDGNMKKEQGPLIEVKKMLGDLREAWDEISARKGLEEKASPASGVNIAG
jgi:flagellar protein FliS